MIIKKRSADDSRITRIFIKFVILMLAIILMSLQSACQNVEGYEEPAVVNEEILEEITTLTVLARDAYTQVLRSAAQSMSTEWAREGRGFRLEHINYSPLYREEQGSSLQTQVMAGQGPDMFFWDGVPFWPHQASGFFADINELIEQNPNTNRSDFFCHVLEAWEFDGSLYIFPLSFEFDSVGISSNLPQSIINRFREYSSITYHELLRIYLVLLNEYPEYSHMAIANNAFMDRLIFEFGFELAKHIDFNDRSSNLNNSDFVSFLEDIKLVKELTPDIGHGDIITRESAWVGYSEYFVFWFSDSRMLNAILEPPENTYLSFTPIAAQDGRLRLLHHYNHLLAWRLGPDFVDMWPAPDWGSISILDTENKALAWEFTQHLITAMAFHNQIDGAVVRGQGSQQIPRPFGRHGEFNTSIRREYFPARFEEMFTWMFLQHRVSPMARRAFGIPEFELAYASQLEIFQEAVDRMGYFNELPVALLPYIPSVLYEDYLQDFLLGFITAQQVAEGIHNRITLWLIE